MWEYVKQFLQNYSLEAIVVYILLGIFLFYQIPKLIIWWFTTDIPKTDDDPSGNDNIKPRGPHDML